MNFKRYTIFPYFVFPAFSVLAFSNPAVWCRVSSMFAPGYSTRSGPDSQTAI